MQVSYQQAVPPSQACSECFQLTPDQRMTEEERWDLQPQHIMNQHHIISKLWYNTRVSPSDTQRCHMGTAIKQPVPDRVKPSFVSFDLLILANKPGNQLHSCWLPLLTHNFCHLICDPSNQPPGFDLPRQSWTLLNRFRTDQGACQVVMLTCTSAWGLNCCISALWLRPWMWSFCLHMFTG